MDFQLTTEDRQTCLKIVRGTLEQMFGIAHDEPPTIGEALEQVLPCFVTLTTARGDLRGCIGCLETLAPLHENLRLYAEKAACEDPRFRPIDARELPTLRIKVAVLGPIEPLAELESIQLGKHGLCVSYGSRRGVLLASVAVEWGWSKTEFLQQTCEKAGLNPTGLSDYTVEYFEEISFEEP
ncbi:MAG: AmmeMemoRadiSam system protein A [Bdellovibrionales bacterium]|nr:AmmeMemoRadiSam system protein A [Bdellovibrionales bacterium]